MAAMGRGPDAGPPRPPTDKTGTGDFPRAAHQRPQPRDPPGPWGAPLRPVQHQAPVPAPHLGLLLGPAAAAQQPGLTRSEPAASCPGEAHRQGQAAVCPEAALRQERPSRREGGCDELGPAPPHGDAAPYAPKP
nr:proline-rich proteoglycan 2-like [Aegilops tauschii subsp. strangulata]